MSKKEIDARLKLVRDQDKKAASSEATQRRDAVLRKTDKLRSLRLEKEAAERLENKDKPAKKTFRKKPVNRTRS